MKMYPKEFFIRNTCPWRPALVLFLGLFISIFTILLDTNIGHAQIAPNIVPNANVSGETTWFFLDGATYDTTVSRGTDGSGSIKMGNEGARILTRTIPVVPGKTYTYSVYMKDSGVPPETVTIFVQIRTPAGTFKKNLFPPSQEVPEANSWYESKISFTPKADEFAVDLYAVRLHDNSPGIDNEIWLDDFYFGEEVELATQPHIGRVASNLVTNSLIAGGTPWIFLDGANYDPTVSRGTDGSGSIKMGNEGARILTRTIPVVPGKKYIYSAYIKDNMTPPGLMEMFVQVRTNQGTYKRNAAGSRQGVAEPNTWYESSIVFTPKADEFNVQLYAVRQIGQSPGTNNVIWLDDVYFGEPVGFEQPPTPKQAFNGSITRVDALGNMEVLSGNTWEPFFPLCIYVDNTRPNWITYSTQGFNCNMWAGSMGQVQKAKDATSNFNPNGMMSGFEVAAFTYRNGWAYKDYNKLQDRLSEINDAGLMNHILLYFWDNENAYNEWDGLKTTYDIIKQLDTDDNGQRMHPIYGLQGNHGISRMYNRSDYRMTDIVGTYATKHNGGVGASPAGLIIQNNIEGQDNPVVFTQLNYGVGANFRSVLYEALTEGAKGVGFWRDTYNNSQLRPSVEQLPWWNDLPAIRQEMDQLLPLLREPHWTTWSVAHQEGGEIIVGTRNHAEEGYVILVNMTNVSKTVTFTIDGLSYQPDEVRDYFTGQRITFVSNGRFTVTIPSKGLGQGTAVYRLAK